MKDSSNTGSRQHKCIQNLIRKMGMNETPWRKLWGALKDNIKEDLNEIDWKDVKLDSSELRYSPVADCCEHSNDSSSST
jgi:hypothetical protein